MASMTEAWARVAWAISGLQLTQEQFDPGSAGYGVAAPDGARRRSAHECRPSAKWQTSRGWHDGVSAGRLWSGERSSGSPAGNRR